ncbi:MAG: diaminopimelate dehydrogenase, partial [Clostridia bacterium]|nr:diaminopimelate dehydrogenase [Clostridia bacterium]
MLNIAIYGYGNLGKGVECASRQNKDVCLTGIYTRRAPETLHTLTDVPVYAAKAVINHKDEIDVLIICGGSATDLPNMTPNLAEHFNVLDSFDNHANIPRHFEAVDAAAKKGCHTALISAGWDPGMFSLSRLYSSAILPEGERYTFGGRGGSQGQSDAIRRIEGVADARQYTVPSEEA